MRTRARRFLWIAFAALLAAGLGGGSAWWALARVPSACRNGPWQYDPLTGNVAAGPYTRAKVARHMPLALDSSETIYLVATTDSSGAPLRCEGAYRLEARDIEACWWSITCYDADEFLGPNEQHRHSYNMSNLERDSDGSATVRLSRSPCPSNWLPTGDGVTFVVVLRLYRPAQAVRDNLQTIALPRIVREDSP
jgi:hypothetical protein